MPAAATVLADFRFRFEECKPVAYRFLLEVPETMVDEANITVDTVPDAQVVVVRNSHGMGFDDPFSDLTIASHSLGIIDALYGWLDDLPKPKPELALVLHSGKRVPLASVSRGEMVSLIRRDQPWVERTLPKIGDHMRDVFPTDASAPAFAPRETGTDIAPFVPVISPTRTLPLLGNLQIAIDVPDLDRAERYYVDFLGMHVIGRERRDKHGEFHPVEAGFDHARALVAGTEADVSFLGNGQISLALDRVGRGAILKRSSGAPIPIGVTLSTFLDIKGTSLMRGMEIDGDGVDVLAVRDIYGMVWEFTVVGETAAASSGRLSA
jgi:catechol 2,3-dioxygenase-like lactoylglutathione lyase family enzyme